MSKMIIVKCENNNCEVDFEITNKLYKERIKNNIPMYCKKCMKQYKLDKLNTGYRNYIDNETEEEKEARRKQKSNESKEMWDNMTPEKRENHKQKTIEGQQNMSKEAVEQWNKNKSIATTKQWQDMTEDEYKLQCKLISLGIENMSPEIKLIHNEKISDYATKRFSDPNEREKASERSINFWSNKDDEYRHHHGELIRLGLSKMTPEEIKLVNQRKSTSMLKYWSNLTYEEFVEWEIKRDAGTINAMLQSTNKNEYNFEMLLIYNAINYDRQQKNEKPLPNFHELIPSNPIANRSFVSPYHRWDFKIYLKNNYNIFVDIDGSVHDPSQNNYFISLSNGTKCLLKDLTEFYDSNRIYQTSGLDAFIVKCFDNNINNDCIVIHIQSGKQILLKDFIKLLKDNSY